MKMARIIGYMRVSTKGQADDGVSPEMQIDSIQKWASANGHEVVKIFDDKAISGKRGVKRDGLDAALSELKKGDIFVVYSLSRLARSAGKAINVCDGIADKGAHFVSTTEQFNTTTPEGKMFFGVMAVLAEFERDQLAKRTKAALAFKRANNEKTGGHVPIGKSVVTNDAGVKMLTINEAEQRMIAAVKELRAAGLSLRKISVELQKRGFVNRKGNAIAPTQINRILAKVA